MPRLLMGPVMEIHFQSPSEMVSDLSGQLDGGGVVSFRIDNPAGLRAGDVRTIVVHVPWLGSQLRLTGKVVSRESVSAAATYHVAISDGPHDTVEHLREIVGRVRSGALLDEAREGHAEGAHEISTDQRLRSMSPSLRALLAAKANAEERLVLARDPDPRVIDFLLKNPSLSLDEVRRLAGRLNLNQAHFALIARNPAWMSDESLRLALARNPRLPEFMAETVLTPLSNNALKGMMESMNTTAGTRRVAGRILQSRGIVVAARRGH